MENDNMSKALQDLAAIQNDPDMSDEDRYDLISDAIKWLYAEQKKLESTIEWEEE